MLKIYTYKGCSTCREALKWLQNHQVAFSEIPIRENPPSLKELQAMLLAKGARQMLFNTSGQDYRALNMKEKLPTMNDSEALKLLSRNGNLVKRPFALDESAGVFLTGFKEDEWKRELTKV